MYLAYLDDSEQREWQVIGAVLIPAELFFTAEMISAMTIEDSMPPDRLKGFQEFHATELYSGEGIFEGIDQNVRFAAISSLLLAIHSCGAKVAYGSLDLEKFRRSPYHTANAKDVAFGRCLRGVGDWIAEKELTGISQGHIRFPESALFIMDEAAKGDRETQAILQRSYRSLRSRFRFAHGDNPRLIYAHDDMYFGDSRYSIGIQIADLCAYFIAKHLYGDKDSEGFYQMIEPHIISAGKDE